jgi:DNA-binding NarL/FixJ family response regulator
MKNAPVCEFISAIRSVHTGGSVLVLKASSKILQRLSAEKKIEERNFDELQPRELEVLKQAAKGKSNKEIASELHISERTVQAHLINIFKKFRANSRTKAVLHALKEGWLTLDDLP